MNGAMRIVWWKWWRLLERNSSMSSERNYRWQREEIPLTSRGIERKDGERGNILEFLGFHSKEEFLDWIRDKKTLDLGAGYGHVRKELLDEEGVSLPNLFSLEPQLKERGFQEKSFEKIAKSFGLDSTTDEEKIRELERKYREGAVAADWLKLPFADKSFERVFSCYGFPYWEGERTNMRKVMEELYRVTTDDTQIRLSPVSAGTVHSTSHSQNPGWGMEFEEFLSVVGGAGFEIGYISLPGFMTDMYCLSLKKSKRNY